MGVKFDKLNRRMFIQGSLGTTFLMPTLFSLLPKEAQANSSQYGPFFVGVQQFGPIYWNNENEKMLMSHSRGGLRLEDMDGHKILRGNLTDLRNRGAFGEYMDLIPPGLLGNMVCINGLGMSMLQGHHRGAAWGNWRATYNGNGDTHGIPNTPTIDSLMANSKVFYDEDFSGEKVMQFNNTPGGFYGGDVSFNYRDPKNKSGGIIANSRIHSRTHDMWNILKTKYFGTGNENGIFSRTDKKTIVDTVKDRLNRVINGRTISSTDKEILQNHVDFVQESTKHFDRVYSCNPNIQLRVKDSDAFFELRNANNEGELIRRQVEDFNTLVVLMMQCGITKLASTYLTEMRDPYGININPSGNITTVHHDGRLAAAATWHDLSHAAAFDDANGKASFDVLKLVVKRAMELGLVDLATKMRNFRFSDNETLLDKSLIMYAPEATWNHEQAELPVFLMGGANGNLSGNQYIDYADRAQPHPTRHATNGSHDYNRLLVSVMDLVGVDYEDYKIPDGQGGFNKGIGSDDRFFHLGLPERGGAHGNIHIYADRNRLGHRLPHLKKS